MVQRWEEQRGLEVAQAFEMESPLAGSVQFSPFADISVPSLAMIGYAAFICSACWPSRFTSFRTKIYEHLYYCLKIVNVVLQTLDIHLTTL